MDIMFYEVFEEEKDALERYLPKEWQVGWTSDTIQSQNSPAPPAAIISTRTQSHIPSDWHRSLKAIVTRSTGYDHLIHFNAEHHDKVKCGYLPKYCSRAVAEHAVMCWIALAKKFKKQVLQFNEFNRDGLTGDEFVQSKVLVVGVGNIGEDVVSILKALGMQVKGVDIVKKIEGLAYVGLEEGIRWADGLIATLPLTDKTNALIQADMLKKAKPGFLVVNVGRGEVTPTVDLLHLLNENHLGGVALDVFEEESDLAATLQGTQVERNETISEILELKDNVNAILTPHNAFNTKQAVDRKAKQTVESIQQFLSKGSLPWVVPVHLNA